MWTSVSGGQLWSSQVWWKGGGTQWFLRSFPPKPFRVLSRHHQSLFPNQSVILCVAVFSQIAVTPRGPKVCSLQTPPLPAVVRRRCRRTGDGELQEHKPWTPFQPFPGWEEALGSVSTGCSGGQFDQQLLMGLSLPMCFNTFLSVRSKMCSVTGGWWSLYSSPFSMSFAECWSCIKMSLSNWVALEKKGVAEFPAGRSILGSLGAFRKNLLE